MRLQGKITRWDDAKGFGFITWHGDGSTVFVHIKAFSGTTRRPELGDIVTYEIAEGSNGKSSANNVRFSNQAAPKKQVAFKHKSGAFALRFSALYVGFLFVATYFNRISWMVLLIYFVVSVVTFFVYAWDKSSARAGRWRIPESNLHFLGLAGGWLGGLAAQRLLRHKSSKREFLIVFWATVLLNVAAAAYLVWIGGASVINRLLDSVLRTVA